MGLTRAGGEDGLAQATGSVHLHWDGGDQLLQDMGAQDPQYVQHLPS